MARFATDVSAVRLDARLDFAAPAFVAREAREARAVQAQARFLGLRAEREETTRGSEEARRNARAVRGVYGFGACRRVVRARGSEDDASFFTLLPNDGVAVNVEKIAMKISRRDRARTSQERVSAESRRKSSGRAFSARVVFARAGIERADVHARRREGWRGTLRISACAAVTSSVRRISRRAAPTRSARARARRNAHAGKKRHREEQKESNNRTRHAAGKGSCRDTRA